jgi:hypothetical protein
MILYFDINYDFVSVDPDFTVKIRAKLFENKSDDLQAVFVARFTQDFGKCLGIEILQSLHEQGMKVVDR